MSAQRAHLRLVAATTVPDVWFCSHCGTRATQAAPDARVCRECELGLLIHAPGDLAPQADEPFLLVDTALKICGLSRGAEAALGLAEPAAVGLPLGDVLVTADSELQGAGWLLGAIGGSGPQRLQLRPAGIFGVRFDARVAPCGPALATLIVLG